MNLINKASNPAQSDQIEQQLAALNQRIRTACNRADRAPEDVRLMLATKTVESRRIQRALDAGYQLLGENKVREGEAKHRELLDADYSAAEWHLIGHLQTNKIKYALRFASCIQSVDRMRLVEKLDQRLQFEGRAINIMLQFNTSGEASKYGIEPGQAVSFARQVGRFDTLCVTGLMTIGRLGAQPEDARQSFRRLRRLRDQLVAKGIDRVKPRELSMGMSGELEVAIEEGANLVRVGTAIFGQRPYPDSHYWPGG
jgi:pyridoxal phosphate enzyme (YggS family)